MPTRLQLTPVRSSPVSEMREKMALSACLTFFLIQNELWMWHRGTCFKGQKHSTLEKVGLFTEIRNPCGEEGGRGTVTTPLFSNSSQGSQAHFHYAVPATSQMQEGGGKRDSSDNMLQEYHKMIFYKSSTAATTITLFDFMLFPSTSPGLQTCISRMRFSCAYQSSTAGHSYWGKKYTIIAKNPYKIKSAPLFLSNEPSSRMSPLMCARPQTLVRKSQLLTHWRA